MYSTVYQTRGQFYVSARGPYVQYSTVYQTRGQFYFSARGPMYVQYSLPDKRAVLF